MIASAVYEMYQSTRDNHKELEILEKTETRFYCDCSKSKVRRAIVTLGKEDLEGLVEDQQPVEAHCDYCNTSYWFQPEELQEILEQAEAKIENTEE